MTRLTTLVASALTVAALAPATAGASTNALRGQPQLERLDADTVRVTFVADERIGDEGVRVGVNHVGTTRTVRAAGRHGRDFKYRARIQVSRDLHVGRKYKVWFRFGDDRPILRLTLLRAAR